jgi:hypothetical protein
MTAKKKQVTKSEETPKKTTKNGNKLFEGAKDGKPFEKGVPKTEEQKQQMRDGWARKKVYKMLFDKITENMRLKLDDDTVQFKELNDALRTVCDALGDKVDKHEFSGAVNIAPPIININPVKSENEL